MAAKKKAAAKKVSGRKHLSIYLLPETKAQLDELATALCSSQSSIVVQAIIRMYRAEPLVKKSRVNLTL